MESLHRPALNPTWPHLALPLLFALSGAALAAPPPLAVARVTPAGVDVAAARQIVIEFNRPVVPLGRMERRADELPVHIAPALECQWRWISREALACQLGEQTAMAPATRYTLSLQPGALAADRGQDLGGVDEIVLRPGVGCGLLGLGEVLQTASLWILVGMQNILFF